eukprot:TRINITY_DN3013_c0_g2_i2.p1 TRINITY_DN3013_c0_g2~~TRINITY_DN3013_c0_g2_i2.p1  ORF type:complete len:101 (+),score=3.89 TRINITY_DN3013_c0_g2_i2:71-373(+)
MYAVQHYIYFSIDLLNFLNVKTTVSSSCSVPPHACPYICPPVQTAGQAKATYSRRQSVHLALHHIGYVINNIENLQDIGMLLGMSCRCVIKDSNSSLERF